MTSYLKPELVTFKSEESRLSSGNKTIFVLDSFLNNSAFLKEFEHILILLIAVLIIIAIGILLLLYSACYWLVKRPKESEEKHLERVNSITTEVDCVEPIPGDEDVEEGNPDLPVMDGRSRAFSLFVYPWRRSSSCMDCGAEVEEGTLGWFKGKKDKRRNTWCNA